MKHKIFEALAEQAEREFGIPRERYGKVDAQDLEGTHCPECDTPIYYLRSKVGYGPSLEYCPGCNYTASRRPK